MYGRMDLRGQSGTCRLFFEMIRQPFADEVELTRISGIEYVHEPEFNKFAMGVGGGRPRSGEGKDKDSSGGTPHLRLIVSAINVKIAATISVVERIVHQPVVNNFTIDIPDGRALDKKTRHD